MNLVVDVVVMMKTSSFEPCFRYGVPAEKSVGIGSIVRVTLGRREHVGYVISEPYDNPAPQGTRDCEPYPDLAPAFDEEGLALARWMAQTYCCTLSEALSSVVYSQAIPRTVERIIPLNRQPAENRKGIPPRLLDLLFDHYADGIGLEELLRHPEARRAADRPELRKALTRLVALEAVRRERIAVAPHIVAYEERRLKLGHSGTLRGKKGQALLELVGQHDSLSRAEVRQAGFSSDVIARAIRAGVLIEERIVTTKRRLKESDSDGAQRHTAIIPTAEQAAALQNIDTLLQQPLFSEILLHGITGSGKTYVYLEAIRRVVAAGETAIILVPEIALTPQTAARFEALFGDAVVVIHSALGERERFEAWQAAQRGEVNVVVGARSAVFVPLPRLRIIVVDEAHEATYRQDQTPRYHTVSVARERLRARNGILILGSATPPLETYARGKLGHVHTIALQQRATRQPLPKTEIIDLAAEARSGKNAVFSTRLIVALNERLQLGEKSVLFVNRRGTARFVLCRPCGFVPICRRCSLALTYHRDEALLRCHLCDAQEPMPPLCPRCKKAPLAPLGLGTERVTSELQEIFPQARIIRMDSDTTTHVGDHAKLLERFANAGDMLVGTQMIAKGLDFPTVTLSAVVAADTGLHVADYRASERTFALLTQVAGRSGRSRPGEAIIQTYLPDHPAVHFAATHDYRGFASSELAERRALQYPPFVRLTYLTLLGRDKARTAAAAHATADRLQMNTPPWQVLGPAFAAVPRVNNEWRMRIAIKAPRLEALRAYLTHDLLPWLRKEPGVRGILELDV